MQFTVSDFSPETFTPLYLMFVAHRHLPLKHFFYKKVIPRTGKAL